MGDVDSERAQAAWRRASDADVVRALKDLQGYRTPVQEIIRSEARRRNLTVHSFDQKSHTSGQARTGDGKQPAPNSPGWIQRHPYRSAAILGLAFPPLALVFTPHDSDWATLLAYFFLLSLICLPQRRYRIILGSSIMASGMCSLYVIAISLGYAFSPDPIERATAGWGLLYLLTFTFGILGGGSILLLCSIAYLRNRYWPLVPAGHCRVCGYDLYGLPEPRCPECGTPFDPEELRGSLADECKEKLE